MITDSVSSKSYRLILKANIAARHLACSGHMGRSDSAAFAGAGLGAAKHGCGFMNPHLAFVINQVYSGDLRSMTSGRLDYEHVPMKQQMHLLSTVCTGNLTARWLDTLRYAASCSVA
jgi:hypothetical protein